MTPLKKLTAAVLALALTATTATAQVRRSLYSNATIPSKAVLDRLNLVKAWHLYVPMGGRKDGIATIQFDNKDIIVQTHSGQVMLLDAETGVPRWRARVGRPYIVPNTLAFNTYGVYIVNSTFLYGLDRDTGRQRWAFRLKDGVAAPPIADEEQIYISDPEGRTSAYRLPRPEEVPPPGSALPAPTPVPAGKPGMKAPGDKGSTPERPTDIYAANRKTTGSISHLSSVSEASEEEVVGPQPVRVWRTNTLLRQELMPVVTNEFIVTVSPSGTALVMARLSRERVTSPEIYRFRTDGDISDAPGHFGDTVYIGSKDFNVYALDIPNNRLQWRFTAGSPITSRVVATEDDVFVTSRDGGLLRLDRATGDPLWRVPRGREVLKGNPEARQFLAANPKYVYAFDTSGRLLVLDRRLGRKLSSYNLRDFTFPIPNEVTDRLYLAANNGLIVCLHDREYSTPVNQRKSEDIAANALKRMLTLKVNRPAEAPLKLSDFLDNFRKRYKLRVVVARPFFPKEEPADKVLAKQVTPPKAEMMPLSDLLTAVLGQVNLTYQIAEDTILIVPIKGAKKPKAP